MDSAEEKTSSLLDILTYRLSGKVTGPLYVDYKSKSQEIERIWKKEGNAYWMLQDYASTVDALLAVSLFYRHVFGHIQGASSFYTSINRGLDKECAISIGSSTLDNEQQRHMQAAVIRFGKILDKFQIGMWFFEFSETVEFLRNCKELFNTKEYETDDTV